jgi:hypothetical protein
VVGLLVFPTVVPLIAASVAAVRHRHPARWVSVGIGATVATVVVMAIVAAATGVMALIVG